MPDYYPMVVDFKCRGCGLKHQVSVKEIPADTNEEKFTSTNKPSAKCPRCHGVTMVAGKFDTGWEAVPCPACQVLGTSHVG